MKINPETGAIDVNTIPALNNNPIISNDMLDDLQHEYNAMHNVIKENRNPTVKKKPDYNGFGGEVFFWIFS